MSTPSSGQISIGNLIKEVLTGNGSTGTTTPNSTQVGYGLSSLKTLTNLTHGTGTASQYHSDWDRPADNNDAPYEMSEFYSKDRDFGGGE
tara:strand:+ start:352 stop:621 length:270 start_codon:yes stop_codon:yes gene_type:complete